MPLNRKVRYGMVGGGPGAFIGAVHRKAAAIDGEIELVAGAFSSDAMKSRRQGEPLFLDPTRVYGSWREMVEGESKLPRASASTSSRSSRRTWRTSRSRRAFIEAGFHVVCDKPMTTKLEDAEELCRLVEEARHRVRAHAQLHRLPDGEAGARARAPGQARRDQEDRRRVSAGVARRRDGDQHVAARPEGRRASRRRSATSACTRGISPGTSPGWRSSRSAPTSRRSAGLRAGGRREPARALPGRRARDHLLVADVGRARRTGCASASTAPRRGSTGGRRTRTTSICSTATGRCTSTAAATTTSIRS